MQAGAGADAQADDDLSAHDSAATDYEPELLPSHLQPLRDDADHEPLTAGQHRGSSSTGYDAGTGSTGTGYREHSEAGAGMPGGGEHAGSFSVAGSRTDSYQHGDATGRSGEQHGVAAHAPAGPPAPKHLAQVPGQRYL